MLFKLARGRRGGKKRCQQRKYIHLFPVKTDCFPELSRGATGASVFAAETREAKNVFFASLVFSVCEGDVVEVLDGSRT